MGESYLCKFDREIGLPFQIIPHQSFQALNDTQSKMFKEHENDYLMSKVLSKKSSTYQNSSSCKNSSTSKNPSTRKHSSPPKNPSIPHHLFENQAYFYVKKEGSAHKKSSTKKKKEGKLLEQKERALKSRYILTQK